MEDAAEAKLADALTCALRRHGFSRMATTPAPAHVTVTAAWRRRTWNTNRAVVLLPVPYDPADRGDVPDPAQVPTGEALGYFPLYYELGNFCQAAKLRVGKAIGYVPFFYGLGLQLVLTGQCILDRARGLERFVDRIDNQQVVLQSIHVVDLAARQSVSVRTWGQVITGRFQDAVEEAIRTAGFSADPRHE